MQKELTNFEFSNSIFQCYCCRDKIQTRLPDCYSTSWRSNILIFIWQMEQVFNQWTNELMNQRTNEPKNQPIKKWKRNNEIRKFMFFFDAYSETNCKHRLLQFYLLWGCKCLRVSPFGNGLCLMASSIWSLILNWFNNKLP